MSEFRRNLLPDPLSFYEAEGLSLTGRGKWRTAACTVHGGSDSMRINTESGAFRCMACGVKGGDVVAYRMEVHCEGFATAARNLGALIDDGKPLSHHERPRTLSARDAMEVVAFELLVLTMVISSARQGLLPNDADWRRFLEGVGRIDRLAMEFRT